MTAAGPSASENVPSSIVERQRARGIYRAADRYGEVTGERLAARGLCWDDVVFVAVRWRRGAQARVAAYVAVDENEKRYRADRQHWVSLRLRDEHIDPAWLDRVRATHELRSDQRPSKEQVGAYDVNRSEELEAEYDRIMGRIPSRREAPYTPADVEVKDGTSIAWYLIDGQEEDRGEVDPTATTSSRVGRVLDRMLDEGRGDQAMTEDDLARESLSRDDAARHEAATRVAPVAEALPTLLNSDLRRLAFRAHRLLQHPDLDERGSAVVRAHLRALQVEAGDRAATRPDSPWAQSLAEYVGALREPRPPTLDRFRNDGSPPLPSPSDPVGRAARVLGAQSPGAAETSPRDTLSGSARLPFQPPLGIPIGPRHGRLR